MVHFIPPQRNENPFWGHNTVSFQIHLKFFIYLNATILEPHFLHKMVLKCNHTGN